MENVKLNKVGRKKIVFIVDKLIHLNDHELFTHTHTNYSSGSINVQIYFGQFNAVECACAMLRFLSLKNAEQKTSFMHKIWSIVYILFSALLFSALRVCIQRTAFVHHLYKRKINPILVFFEAFVCSF